MSCVPNRSFTTLAESLTFVPLCTTDWNQELIEEYTITTKRLLNHAIRAQLLVHLLLLLDRLPPLAIAAGIAAHLAYLRCMRRFPYIKLTAPEGLVGIGESGCQLGGGGGSEGWQ